MADVNGMEDSAEMKQELERVSREFYPNLREVERKVIKKYGLEIRQVALMHGSFQANGENTVFLTAIFYDDVWTHKTNLAQNDFIKEDLEGIAEQESIADKLKIKIRPISLSQYNALNGENTLNWE
ncbi:MAG: hypothetical protein AABX66_01530 [Nanoarchaeota archaeon]